MRLVLDTNVVLDIFHWNDSLARPLLDLRSLAQCIWLADATTLDELARVVHYPAFGLNELEAEQHYRRYLAWVEILPLPSEPPPLPRCRDPDDQKFLNLAMIGKADLLVSRDKALLGLRGRSKLPFLIVTPSQALAHIVNSKK